MSTRFTVCASKKTSTSIQLTGLSVRVSSFTTTTSFGKPSALVVRTSTPPWMCRAVSSKASGGKLWSTPSTTEASTLIVIAVNKGSVPNFLTTESTTNLDLELPPAFWLSRHDALEASTSEPASAAEVCFTEPMTGGAGADPSTALRTEKTRTRGDG